MCVRTAMRSVISGGEKESAQVPLIKVNVIGGGE